ncbi:MAG: KpsF/GutQ family sugar-phosphate isomerase, partial [Alphaproteobacteria bacterium]|nr:KpsF/GutQ family sugar-phosphate isomerase [Alphaproteobacteria bacterium]
MSAPAIAMNIAMNTVANTPPTTIANTNTHPPAQPDAIAAIVRRVVELEAAGVASLAQIPAEHLAAAVAAMQAVKGKLVVSGMGKSGHIARKIAATLSSTGTPAFFVHPAEASHGDLGMLTSDDGLLLLSSSGNTAELASIITYAKRFGIPLIAMTQSADSQLALTADHLLLIPKLTEACSLGMAPTTSTTVMLALGDALAVALHELKGFSRADYKTFHPGGTLGSTLLFVRDILRAGEDLPMAKPTTTVAEAAEIMGRSIGRIGGVCVVDDQQKLVGVFTDGVLRRNFGHENLAAMTLQELMTVNPVRTTPD